MALAPGTRIGACEIQSVIGAGGMGEVYRALDTKLGRIVALKVLPEAFATDADRLARFEREARTLATLNHPHIAQIYGIEEAGGSRALVMELVEGEDLSQRLARGAIPVDEALRMAAQIAEAIEVAHEQGVIHRDLKPANIKVTPDGVVKVLDFGLAKAMDRGSGIGDQGSVGLANSPTITSPAGLTQAGMILGTAAYMSPEQAHGRVADKRSDVWAFGCVLYEMLTGRQAFAGNDVMDTLAAVMRSEPDWHAWPSDVPAPVQALVRGCLTKNRRDRVSDIAVARYALQQLAASPASGTSPARQSARPGRERWYAGAVGLAVIAALVLGALPIRKPPVAPPPIIRLSIQPAGDLSFRPTGIDRDFVLTPDGKSIVYRTRSGMLAVRALDQFEPRLLAGTFNARSPFTSADGQWVGYWAGGTLRKVPISGGLPDVIAASSGAPRGHAWAADNSIFFASNDGRGLLRVPAKGGTPEVLTTLKPGEQGHWFPSLLPGGHAVLFTISANSTERNEVAAYDLRTGDQKVLLTGGTQPLYVEPGYLVYLSGNTMRAVSFDADRLEVRGAPVVVLEQVSSNITRSSNADISRNGDLVFVAGSSLLAMRSLVWVDRAGRATRIPVPSKPYVYPRVSPDGTRVAVDVRDNDQDIWVSDLRRGTSTRLTFGSALDAYPSWTADGRQVVFASSAETGAQAVYRQAADGTGRPQRIATGPVGEGVPLSVIPGGRGILIRRGSHLGVLSLTGSPTAEPLVQTNAVELNGEVSPDGRWLAYESTESGRPEVYVRPFPDVAGGRWQVSNSGGSRPAWARNGRELFYEDQDGGMTAAPVAPGPTFSAGVPVRLFDARAVLIGGTTLRSWDPAPDGRFLMVQDDGLTTALPLLIVLNWVEELKATFAAGARP